MELKVSEREKTGQKVLDEKRRSGLIPGVLYGHGTEASLIWVEALSFGRVYADAGQSSILSLTGAGKPVNAIVHDIQKDPLSGRFTHVDFFQVKMNEALETHVALEFEGEAPAVREQGGILVKTLEEVLVSCLPKDLPHNLTVDVSRLASFDDRIKIEDLAVPAGVTILTEGDTVVALVEPPRTDAEMAELDEAIDGDVSQVASPEEPKEEGPEGPL
jgi:large subunit ribosomal protein L25